MSRIAKLLSRVPVLAAAVVVTLVAAAPSQACPNCKEMIADSSAAAAAGPGGEAAGGIAPAGRPAAAGNLASGFNYAVMLMLAVPILMAGGFIGAIYLALRRTGLNDFTRGGVAARPSADT